MKKYTYLLFDVDNTLLDFDRSEHAAMADALREHGFAADDDIIAKYALINDEHWELLERGEMDRETLVWHRFQVLGEVCGLPPMDPVAFAKSYIKHLTHKSFLMDGALPVCEQLAKEYTLVAITNGNAGVQHGRFDPSPLFPLFKDAFISEDIGYNKPAQQYFDAVAAALPDLEPSRALVIGDSLSSDITGGVRWGCDTCWLCLNEQNRGAAQAKGLNPTYTISHLRELLDILL
ncbi:MAG: YjjG family noncanonical pyrimidine nucleotidase [Clostridia bacterium]|nr:YjjG family noncanonical pyrimidine nucleotidase [Clostridia bacterium]